MSVTATPIFSQAGRIGPVLISTANTNRDGSGTIGVVFTAGTNGSMIDHIDIEAAGTVTAGVVRLYIHNNVSFFLWREILVTATIPSTTIAAFFTSIDCSLRANAIILPPLYSIRASTNNAESFNIFAFGSDL